MRIELLLIGDELLTGELDPYPSKILSAVRGKGASISRITVVPDVVRDIVLELDAACSRGAGLVLATGGLGPTIDDVTRHALAGFLGKELVVDAKAKEWMEEALLVRHGRRPKASSAALLMAMVPEGTEALPNPNGVACGIKAALGDTTIICVPGFPNEMLAMFELYFLPLVTPEGQAERMFHVKRRETTMEPIFQAIAKEFGVRVASLPKEDWREGGNVVVIRGPEDAVEAASKRFLELVEASRDEWEDKRSGD
jgi:nicotinamide-nucleotide amidase